MPGNNATYCQSTISAIWWRDTLPCWEIKTWYLGWKWCQTLRFVSVARCRAASVGLESVETWFLEQLCLQSLPRHWSCLPAILKENSAATRMLQVSIDAARPPHRVSKTSSDCKLGSGTDVDDKEWIWEGCQLLHYTLVLLDLPGHPTSHCEADRGHFQEFPGPIWQMEAHYEFWWHLQCMFGGTGLRYNCWHQTGAAGVKNFSCKPLAHWAEKHTSLQGPAWQKNAQ